MRQQRCLWTLIGLLVSFWAYAQIQPAPYYLSGPYTPSSLKDIILPRSSWHPFPTVAEPEGWQSVPDSLRAQQVAEGEKALDYHWPALTAMLFLDYVATGNRDRYQEVYFERRRKLADLVIAEAIEGKGRFLQQIVNGLWLICEESYWGVPAHLYLQKSGSGLPDVTEPTVDLFAAQTASLLAWADYLLGDEFDGVSPLLRDRIFAEVDRRVLTPCLERNDFWWMGFNFESGTYTRRVNNWNPWICSSWLSAVLLLERDEDRRLAAVHKIMRALDNFLNPHPRDGGCDEGPGYWGHAGASLFDCLEMLHSVSQGKINLYQQPLIREMGAYIYKAHIHANYFVNFADAAPVVTPPADLVQRFGTRTQDARLQQFGTYLANRLGPDFRNKDLGMDRRLAELFNYQNLKNTQPKAPLLRDAWLPDSQLMFARSEEGTSKGLFLAMKGGHNDESHNHNDVGNFIVYVNGQPALIDVGVGAYSAKTFSKDRYSIWSMQSAYHNLPSLNGQMQQAGRQFEATNVQYKFSNAYAQLGMELAKTYPAEAGVESWVRTMRLTRGKNIALQEKFKFKTAPAQITLNLMTSCKVTPVEAGHIMLTKKGGRPEENFSLYILFDPAQFKYTTETVSLQGEENARLRGVWGEELTRIVLEDRKPAVAGTWKILIRQ